MTEPNALDYSWSRPDPAAMARAGIKAVCRYLTGAGKAIDRAELAALHAAGIAVVLNYEADAGDARGGAAAGATARRAAVVAAKALGAPAGTPIYYSIDFDVTGDMPTVLAYLKACDDPDYPARCYGEASVLDAYGRPGWQTLAWSGGALSGHAVLYQYAINQKFGTADVDHNRILDAAQLGAWWPSGHTPQDATNNPVGGLTMADAQDILAAVNALRVDVDKRLEFDYGGGKTVAGTVQGIATNVVRAAIAPLAAQVAGLQSAVSQLKTGSTVDMAAVQKAAEAGAAAALAGYQLTLSKE